MRAPNDPPTGTPRPPKSSTVVLLGTVADTTWRMFVPIIGLLMFGLWLDKKFDTLPWAMIILTIVGIAAAAELIRRQLVNVKK